jgi:hypothetical protein
VVDEHPVHALLDGVEEAHGLAINVDDHGCIPAVSILVVTANNKTDQTLDISTWAIRDERNVVGLSILQGSAMKQPAVPAYRGAMVITLCPLQRK